MMIGKRNTEDKIGMDEPIDNPSMIEKYVKIMIGTLIGTVVCFFIFCYF